MARTLKVVDTHAHLGECCVFGLVSTEEELLRRMDENGVDATIVQPYPGVKDAPETHDRIAELCVKHPGRFFGLASVSPHGNHEAYRREMERCIRDLHFVGIKLHTIGHGVNPLSEDGDFVFQPLTNWGFPLWSTRVPASPSLYRRCVFLQPRSIPA